MSFYSTHFSVRWNKIPTEDALGDFELLIDEDLINLQDGDSHYLVKNSYKWK